MAEALETFLKHWTKYNIFQRAGPTFLVWMFVNSSFRIANPKILKFLCDPVTNVFFLLSGDHQQIADFVALNDNDIIIEPVMR